MKFMVDYNKTLKRDGWKQAFWTHSWGSEKLEYKMVGMEIPGTYPASESFPCNWSFRLPPSQSLFRSYFTSEPFLLPKPTSHGAEQHMELPPQPRAASYWLPIHTQQPSISKYTVLVLHLFHPSLFCHCWGKYWHLCAVQLLDERWEIKLMILLPQTSHHSRCTKIILLGFLICILGLTLPICLHAVLWDTLMTSPLSVLNISIISVPVELRAYMLGNKWLWAFVNFPIQPNFSNIGMEKALKKWWEVPVLLIQVIWRVKYCWSQPTLW